MGNQTRTILEKLKANLSIAEQCNESRDSVSWRMQEGVLISCNDAKLLIELIEKSVSNLDLEELERKVDLALDKETKESLNEWLKAKHHQYSTH